MLTAIQKEILTIFTPPVYIVTDNGSATIVDKMELKEDKWQRTRYFITGQQCTCKGYLNTRNCKHLKMVSGEYEGTGVTGGIALQEAERIVEAVGKHFPEEAATWVPDRERIPDNVGALSFTASRDKFEKATILCEKKFESGTLVIAFHCVPKLKSK